MIFTVSETQPPPENKFADTMERGLDPWHVDAFPNDLKFAAINGGERKTGWYYVDWCGNVVGWVPDGTQFEVTNEVTKWIRR